MSIIAQGMITLTSVNDAFSVSLSPSSCVINADYNGKNPKLDYAFADIKVIRGDTEIPFDEPVIIDKTNLAVAQIVKVNPTTWRIYIRYVPNTTLNGSFRLLIKVGDEFQTTTVFSYTVVRETSMLDWILDWNGTYTEISGKWIITPKIFAGTKNEDNEITGVYLGPAFDDANGTGLYGYKDNEIIFQLTDSGGLIGGWHIDNGGIQTEDGCLKILSEGSIVSAPDGEMAWELNKDGSASFAGGNVQFEANGDAFFKGKITSTSGSIGGWSIGQHSIWSQFILIDSTSRFIGIRKQTSMPIYYLQEPSKSSFYDDITDHGGIAIFSESSNSYGIECWVPTLLSGGSTIEIGGSGLVQDTITGVKVFSLGSDNQIAGWHFDNNALYRGTKNNTAKQNTVGSGHITIGTNGLRGANWYIDDDGEISFVGGLLHFDQNGGTISGWSMNNNRLSNPNLALVSASMRCGLYLSVADISDVSDSHLENTISNNGGIVLKSSQYGSYLQMWQTDGSPIIYLSSIADDANYIGRWYFDTDAFFYGNKVITPGLYTQSGCITVSPYGLRGFKWRFESDGSGALAGGKIAWDKNGNVTLDSAVKIAWTSVTGTDVVTDKLTKIDANGIYTGTISADNITAGTISTASIKSDGKWALNTDGSGMLASGNISWTKEGVLSVQKAILNNVRINGTIRQPWSQSGIYVSIGNESMSYDNIAAGASGGWNDGSIASMLTWTLQDSGRIVRIANWKWGSTTFDGDLTITAPDGKYFFEDGLAKSKLVLSREIVELIGYADNSTFYGWAVVNRVNFNTRARYGRRLNCLAMGIVTDNGSATPNVECTTFDGSSITVARTGTGIYEMTLPSAWQLEADGYQVMVTGYGAGYMKGTLASRTSTKCVIHVSDDSSPNNGSFQFQIFNTNDWIG